jgi:hypothetical protein
MVRLTPAARAKLEGIVAAGGLKQPADVVRVTVAPSDPDVAAVWGRYLKRNFDSLVAMAERICDPMDLVLFDGETVTVCRHPKTTKAPERVQREVAMQFNEKLFGRHDGRPLAAMLARTANAAPLRLIVDKRPDEEALPPELESAIALISGDVEPPKPPPVEKQKPPEPPPPPDVKMQRVTVGLGQTAIWVKPGVSAPRSNAGDDYFRSAMALVQFDVALAMQTADIAKRMIADRAPPVQLMFPVNINGLRRPEHRAVLVTGLRDIDGRAAQRMDPVLVRCEQGVPQSVIVEAAGYLRKTFGMVWIFAGRHSDPRNLFWADSKMGVLFGSADAAKGQLDAWRAAAEKHGWQIGVLS